MPKINIGDIQLYYDVYTQTEGGGEAVLFLHDLGGSSHDWYEQVPAFEHQYRVVVVDLPGHGESDKPQKAPTMADLADSLVKMMDIFRLGSAHMIGLGLGGMIALQLAIRHPRRAKSLLIVNAAPMFTGGGFLGNLASQLRGFKGHGNALAKKYFPKPEQEVLRQRFKERWLRNDPQAYQAVARAMAGWTVVKDLGAITIPTCFMIGDRAGISEEPLRRYAAQISKGEVMTVPDAHGALPMEHPSRFNELARAFVDKHTDRPVEKATRG